MSAFEPIPLGQRIPDRLHAVSYSLPTMRAVIGYEEKQQEIVRQLTTGYPRFVVHPLLRQAGEHILSQRGLAGHDIWLPASDHSAAALVAYVGEPARTLGDSPLPAVVFPSGASLSARAKKFLQHTGSFQSSRVAEDYLHEIGVLERIEPEALFVGDAESHVRAALADQYRTKAGNLFLAPSGMNAIYAALGAVARVQAAKGRTKWVQLGWLYLDTIALLSEFFGGAEGDYIHWENVFDLGGLRELFEREGARIAGVFTETPSNPLMQTSDLPALHALCRKHGILLVADPSMASPLNLNILPHADIAVNSLTKYTASEGDVIAGALVLNDRGAEAAALRAALPQNLEPVYSRDIARLAAQIGQTASIVATLNRQTARVVDFLQNHPRVTAVFWALHPESREHYLQLARSPEGIGGIISFTTDVPLNRFYDRVRLPKGPSFGLQRSLISPFIYLAHYELVTNEAGRRKLAENKIPIDLLRLSIGCEPVEEIIAALDEALG